MKLYVMSALAVGAAMLVSFQADPAHSNNAPHDVSEIRSIEASLYSLTNADVLLRSFAPDAAVIDPYRPGVSRGLKEIRELLRGRLRGVRTRSPDIRQVDIVASSHFACVAMQIRETTVMDDGSTSIVAVRHLDALEKDKGGWKIVQQHVSLPTDQKTGQAIFDAAQPAERYSVWYPRYPASGPVPIKQAKTGIYQWMLTGTHTTSADQMMDWYVKDPRVVLYDAFAPGYIRGTDRIRDYYAPMMAGFKSVQTTFPQFSAASDGILGSQIDTQELRVQDSSGHLTTYKLRQNDCVIQVRGKWKTFFEHISMPAANTGVAS